MLEELIVFAANLVSNVELAESLANQVLCASEGMGSKQGMFAQLAQLALETNNKEFKGNKDNQKEKNIPEAKKLAKIKPKLEECDIRFIVKNGSKKGMSIEEALEEVGIIKECDEILRLCK